MKKSVLSKFCSSYKKWTTVKFACILVYTLMIRLRHDLGIVNIKFRVRKALALHFKAKCKIYF